MSKYKIRSVAFVAVATALLFLFGCGTANDGEKKNEKEDPIMNVENDTALGRWLEAHGVEYYIADVELSPEKLTELYEKELEKGRHEGYTPVIVLDDGTGDSLLLSMLEEYDPESLLQAELPDGKAFLDSRIDEFKNPSDPSLDALDPDMLRDDSAVGAPFNAFISYSIEMDGSIAHIVKLPTDKPWEAVLYLPFGGWNSCPDPEHMAGVCKYWYEKYSAYPALIAGEEMNFYLPAPVPESEACEAALEHFAFCEDVLFQGMGYINAVEDYIRQSTVWYFWWD